MTGPGNAKVLLATDDESLTAAGRLALEEAGHGVEVARDGPQALEQLHRGQPDLVILDAVLPKMEGWEICRRLREVSDIPILMLTPGDGESDGLKGLRSGADVCMARPLALSVLVAQVEALLRRSRPSGESSRPATVAVGDLRIDLSRQEVSLAGKRVDLSPTEFRLLTLLASRPGELFSHRELLTRVWGPEYLEEDSYLKLYIWYLRQKIEEDPGHPRYILTKRGQGYRLGDGSPSRRRGAPSKTIQSEL